MKIANFQDQVKYKKQGIIGTVIAKYTDKNNEGKDELYFDVRMDDKVYFKTIAKNWMIVKKKNE